MKSIRILHPVSLASAPKFKHRITLALLVGLGLLFALGCLTSPRDFMLSKAIARDSNALASVHLRIGWATFGQVLPQGASRDGLQVGNLPTQTDIKTRWPDGSIRFAVVTVQVPRIGAYPLRAAAVAPATFKPRVPEMSVRFRMNEQLWIATLPDDASKDVWLSGALVYEWRRTVTPVKSSGEPHPHLRVIFDCRSYSDGQARVDVAVENTLDVPGANTVVYDVEIVAEDRRLFYRKNVIHWYLTRWRKIFPIGFTESYVTVDFEPAYRAKAIPRYLPIVKDQMYSVQGQKFDILNIGGLFNPMNAPGGRSEIAPYPDWTARYLRYQRLSQKAYVLAHGDLAGSWPIHIREPDGRLISIDKRPGFWLDGRERKERPDGPKSNIPGSPASPFKPDIAHQPSLAYVPYLVTGDRYYADEMAFWANYVIIGSWPGLPGSDILRKGKTGLIFGNQVRGIGWGLRNMVDAAVYLPDNDPMKSYFQEKVENNLRWADQYASAQRTPLGTSFDDKRPENQFRAPKRWIAQWEQNYLAWAIDHAARQGFTSGLKLRDRIVKFQLSLFTSPEYPRTYGAPYVLAVGERRPNGRIRYYKTLKQVFQATYGNPPGPHVKFPGYYGVDVRLMLMIAMKLGMPGAEKAYNYVHPKIGVVPFTYHMPDLARRSGWAIDKSSYFTPKR